MPPFTPKKSGDVPGWYAVACEAGSRAASEPRQTARQQILAVMAVENSPRSMQSVSAQIARDPSVQARIPDQGVPAVFSYVCPVPTLRYSEGCGGGPDLRMGRIPLEG